MSLTENEGPCVNAETHRRIFIKNMAQKNHRKRVRKFFKLETKLQKHYLLLEVSLFLIFLLLTFLIGYSLHELQN